MVKDWQVLQMLNELASTLRPSTDSEPCADAAPLGSAEILTQAESLLREALPSLDLPFRQPELELLGIVAGIGPITPSSASNVLVPSLA